MPQERGGLVCAMGSGRSDVKSEPSAGSPMLQARYAWPWGLHGSEQWCGRRSREVQALHGRLWGPSPLWKTSLCVSPSIITVVDWIAMPIQH